MIKLQEIVGIFKKADALLEGHFKLSSGLHSSQYLQCARVLEDPRIAERVCGALAGMFRQDKPSVVVAPALGGIIVSYEVARSLGVRGVFSERVDGKMCLRRGFALSKKDRALIVEDVITTGKSTKEVIEVVKETGAEIIGVGSIADRSEQTIKFGAPFKSLVKIDIITYKPEDCPMCKKKIPLVKPGSRTTK